MTPLESGISDSFPDLEVIRRCSEWRSGWSQGTQEARAFDQGDLSADELFAEHRKEDLAGSRADQAGQEETLLEARRVQGISEEAIRRDGFECGAANGGDPLYGIHRIGRYCPAILE